MKDNVIVRGITLKDYEFINKWWEDSGYGIVDKQYLPDNGLGGLIVEKNGVPLAAAYTYTTNSRVCYMDNLVSNFNYKGRDRYLLIKKLFDTVINRAKECGCEMLWTLSTTRDRGIVKRCAELGCQVSDEPYYIISTR